MVALALFGLLFLAGPAFAQDMYQQQPSGGTQYQNQQPLQDQKYQQQPMEVQKCQSPQFFCGSLNRCANTEECNTADKEKGFTPGKQPMMDYQQKYDQMSSQDTQKQYKPQYDQQRDKMMSDPNLGPEDTRWDGSGKQSGDQMMNRGMQNEWQGPSEEEMQKQEARMNEKRFQQMKQGLSQFKSGMKGMKKGVTSAKKNLGKCGVSLPEELTGALDKSDDVVKKLDAAKTADELEDIVGDVEDVGSVMQEWGPKLGDLFRICEMMKRSDADFKRMQRDVNRVVKLANVAKKKIDLSEMADGLEQALAKLKEVKDSAKALAKTDPEEALTKLEDEFYGEFETLNNARQEIETVLNVTKGIRSAKSEVKRYTSQLKSLKRNEEKDTSELEADLKDVKQKIDELESFMKQKGKKSADEIIELVEELFDLREKFFDKLNELRGGSEFRPKIKAGQSFDFRLPEGFERKIAPEGIMEGGGEGFPSFGGEMMQNF